MRPSIKRKCDCVVVSGNNVTLVWEVEMGRPSLSCFLLQFLFLISAIFLITTMCIINIKEYNLSISSENIQYCWVLHQYSDGDRNTEANIFLNDMQDTDTLLYFLLWSNPLTCNFFASVIDSKGLRQIPLKSAWIPFLALIRLSVLWCYGNGVTHSWLVIIHLRGKERDKMKLIFYSSNNLTE